MDRDEAIQRFTTPSNVRLLRHTPTADQLPTEPPDEFSKPVDLVLVPGLGTGQVPGRVAMYRARQAVWGGNPWNLSSHVETLPAATYGTVLRSLVEQLDRADQSDRVIIGLSTALLKAVSGRTTSGVLALCASLENDSTALLRLDLTRGGIRFPPYWRTGSDGPDDASDKPAGYFRPTSAQAACLEPANDDITLPLPRAIHRVLRRHEQSLRVLAHFEPGDLDAVASQAIVTVATELGVEFTVATLRRSLGAHITEISGDIALAQLVCGDSFGQPSSQQHYYAPRRSDIARAYSQAVAVHFEESATTSLHGAGQRVGSQLLITPAFARALAQSSHDGPFAEGTDKHLPQWLLDHRRQLDHLARMVIATTGHRPAEALFELTLHDFDTTVGIGLYRDKRHDEAHDPRLVALPTVLSKQIIVFTQHLQGLASRLPQMSPVVADVLSGERPMLIDFDQAGTAIRPTLAMLRARSPDSWNVLPWNWGRTYIRTRGIDMGASAFVLACQLGHYDAVGYPFGQQSPTSPLEVVRELRPVLDRIATAQGWEIIEDAEARSASRRRTLPPKTLPPVRDWTADISASDEAITNAHSAWQRNVRALARSWRDDAIERVLEHPDLIAAGLNTTYRAAVVQTLPQPLDELAIHEIGDDLVAEAGDDAPAAIALLRALRHVLRKVSSKTGQTYPAIPLPIVLRRPLDNPFFVGSCLALGQMDALRQHVAIRARTKRPERTYALQVARTAEALALFGFIDNPDQLLAILSARSKALPSARIPDLMLVPLPDHTVVGLRGVATLALAALARAYPDDPLPTRPQLLDALKDILPTWATTIDNSGGTSPDLLVRMCSTTAVANRYELSPAARFALDPCHGSTNAEIHEQLAFIDADTVTPVRQSGPTASQPLRRARMAAPGTMRSNTANRQYRDLCRTIPLPHRDLHLPLTGVHVPANSINSTPTRRAVVAELDAQLDQLPLWPIVRMLTSWIRSEAERQAGSAGALANSTLSTYLTRIGGALVQVLGALEFGQFSEDTLEDAFAFCLDASREAKHKVAAALLSFYRGSADRWDLPDLDLGFVYAELDHGRHQADSALILPVDRDKAIAQLERAAWDHESARFEQKRLARLAHVVTYPLAWAGCRINEVLGLQVRDVGCDPAGLMWARVRSNRRRSLKTLAASRTLIFSKASPTEQGHRAYVLQRIDDVRRQAERRPDAAYLLDDSMDATGCTSTEAVAQTIRDTLSAVTGRPTERLHRLRHLVANEFIRDTALSHQDRAWIGLESDPETDTRPLTPRDFARISVAMGHAHWRTTLQCYLHLPWILTSRPAQHMRDIYFRRQYVAGALGFTPATLDWVLRDRDIDCVTAWFDHFRPRRIQPALEPTAVISAINRQTRTSLVQDEQCAAPSSPSSVWTAVRVGRLVDLAARTRSLESAMRSIGAPMGDADRLLSIAARWERKLGLRLLPEYANGRPRAGCPARAVRHVHADRVLETMWIDYDANADSDTHQVHQLIDDFHIWLQPSRRHAITLPQQTATMLIAWLVGIGIARQQIDLVDLGGGMQELAVRRSTDANDHRHHGMGLRRILIVMGISQQLRASAVLR